MRTIFSRRQIETVLAAMLAALAGIVGLASRDDDDRVGPRVLALEKVGSFHQPVHLSQPPGSDSPLFVVERHGTVRVIADGQVRREPFLDLRRQVKHTGFGGEQGMLSIAFAPDYAETGLFYVAYTDRRNALRLVELRRRPDDELRADPRSARLVLRIPHPTTMHPGGLLLFGPDKSLYVGSGDGGPWGDPDDVAQSKRSLLGKILRIDPRRGLRPGTVAPGADKPKGRQGKREGRAGAGEERGTRLPRRRASRRPTRSPRRTRSSAGPGATRSSPTGSATPGASPSTAPRTASRSATSATTASRRSTSCRSARPAAPTSAGPTTRATRP